MSIESVQLDEQKVVRSRIGLLLGILGSVITGTVLPFFYLNGKAYHDGYIGYFELDASMFSLDVSNTFVNSVMAWMTFSITGISGVMKFIGGNVLLVIVACIVFSLIFGSMVYFFKKRAGQIEKLQESINRSHTGLFWWKEVLKCFLLYLAAPGYLLFAFMLFVALLIIGSILPFVRGGEQQAANDLLKEFSDSPVVRVADSRGAVGDYRLMRCSDSFCALDRQGVVITVPIASITMAVSDVSEKLLKVRTENEKKEAEKKKK